MTRLYCNLISFIIGLPLEHPLSSIINTSLSTPLANIFHAPLSTHLDLLSRKKATENLVYVRVYIYIIYTTTSYCILYYRELKDNHNNTVNIVADFVYYNTSRTN